MSGDLLPMLDEPIPNCLLRIDRFRSELRSPGPERVRPALRYESYAVERLKIEAVVENFVWA